MSSLLITFKKKLYSKNNVQFTQTFEEETLQ